MTDALNDIDWPAVAGKAGMAIAILVVTWILAKIVAWAFGKLTSRVPVLKKAGSDGESLGASLGKIGSLLVWLFGLVALLQVFELDQVLAPIQTLLTGIMAYLPNIIGAAFVFFVGALLAKIVRQLIESALGAVPFQRWFSSASNAADKATGTAARQVPAASPAAGSTPAVGAPATSSSSTLVASLPRTIATIVYALIMIVVTIAALQILKIQSISAPAEKMLTAIFDAIPALIAAAIMLGIGVLIARFAGDLLRQVLDGIGVDKALREVDVLPADKSATPALAKVAQVAIVLFFAVMAAQALGFPQITTFLSEVLELGGRVLFGGAIIAAGFFISTLLAKLASGTGALIIRYATLILFVAMGLKYMGIADSIIELAFGALVVGGAAAAALAFGLGGRDAAARKLGELSAGSPGASTPTRQDGPPTV